MKTTLHIASGLLVALPLLAGAQSTTGNPAVLPADQPRTPLEQQQTQQTGEATKYGQKGSDQTTSGVPSKKYKPAHEHSTGKDSSADSTTGVAPKKPETPTAANPGK